MMKKNKNSSKAIFSIVGFLNRFPKRCFNYKQICKQLGVVDASGKNHVIKTLKKLNERKKPTSTTFFALKKKSHNSHFIYDKK